MKYIQFVNSLIRKKSLDTDKLVLFGQNINAGSCISGLTKNIKVKEGSMIINTPNCENTQAGLGLGLMINGVSSVFFMKQQDFLLLGIDQLVNTYNFIRRNNPSASFTIVFVIVDLGYQGLQSSLNNFGDFCSIARIPGFTITNKSDAEKIIDKYLVHPGFRIMGVSQRLFKEEMMDIKPTLINEDNTIFQYTNGEDATIVCFNFSFPYGLELNERLNKKKINASLFNVNAVTPIDWKKIIDNVKKTKKLVIIDDSKSENLSCDNLLSKALSECKIEKNIVIKREFPENWLWPNHDKLEINYDKIIDKLTSKSN